MDPQQMGQRLAELGMAFSPSAPIDKYALFAGRKSQVTEVVNAVTQRGQHVIIFGERGVGKTSLANVLYEIIEGVGPKLILIKTNCDTSDDFASIWRKLFRNITISSQKKNIGFDSETTTESESLDRLLGDAPSPDDIRHLFQLINKTIIVVIDEVDRIRYKKTTTLLADTIKTLSDHSINATLILLGVANSVNDLIAEHSSIERALVQVHMPRMSFSELIEIINKSTAMVNMTIDGDTKTQIAHISQGLPHYTHLLGLNSAISAVSANRLEILDSDLNMAVHKAVDKAQQTIQTAYHKATSSPRKESLHSRVLLACALAASDMLGYFTAADVRAPMSRIMKRPFEIPAFSRHLNDFCDSSRGPILEKTGASRKFRFRFINPLMQPFVLMHGLSHQFITLEDMKRLNALNAR